MKKAEQAFVINIAILVIGLAGLVGWWYFSAGKESVAEFVYDICVGLLSGSVVAIVYCLHDRSYERRALMRFLNEYKSKIRKMLQGNDNLTPDQIKELNELALEYRIVLSEFGSDDECKKVNVAVAKCLIDDPDRYPTAVQELRQIVAK